MQIFNRTLFILLLFTLVVAKNTHAAGLPLNAMSFLAGMSDQDKRQALSMLGNSNALGKQRLSQQNSSSLQSDMTAQILPADDTPVKDGRNGFQENDSVIIYFFKKEEAAQWDKKEPPSTYIRDYEEQQASKQSQRLFLLDNIAYVAEHQRQIYRLDESGRLSIPGVDTVNLLGLTEDEATHLLNTEPSFIGYHIRVKRIPVKPIGKSSLSIFGMAVFGEQAISEQLVADLNVAVPADYTVGPGDIVHIQLFGKQNEEYYLEITRDGRLAFPGIGSIPVSGLSFKEMKKDLLSRVSKQFIGVTANITMGELRSMQIFVLGEVKMPGAHVVNALATITHGLVKSGGLTDIASTRQIFVKRRGKLVKMLDLYDLLVYGDNSDDIRLLPGDVIYVPPNRTRVYMLGAVKRPGIYEIRSEDSMKDLLHLAGGFKSDADESAIHIERITDDGKKIILDIRKNQQNDKLSFVDGDTIVIDHIEHTPRNRVTLTGAVVKETEFEWRNKLYLSQVLPNANSLKTNADFNYVLVRTTNLDTKKITIRSASLFDIWAQPKSSLDILLSPEDEITVLGIDEQRNLAIQHIIQQLHYQSDVAEPARIVRIDGEIFAPGSYPLERDMRISDLIRAGGRLQESAFILEAELTRFNNSMDKREIEHIIVDLKAVLAGDEQANILLKPYDLLHIKEVPLWAEQGVVELLGEVRFPGRYPIKRGETISSVIQRAGGFTALAYIDGAVFTREELRKREQQRMDEMAANLEAELAAINLERSGEFGQSANAGVAGQLLETLKRTKAAGRLVIDLEAALAKSNSAADLILREGDRLLVPTYMQEVTVIGEVFYPTSHIFRDGFDAADYIKLSGGETRKADASNAYVIRANGQVVSAGNGLLSMSTSIKPGDSIVVPLDAESIDSLKLWSSVSQIVYQLGVAAVAWKQLGLVD